MISSYAESFQSQLAGQWQVVCWELGHDDVHGKTRRHASLPAEAKAQADLVESASPNLPMIFFETKSV